MGMNKRNVREQGSAHLIIIVALVVILIGALGFIAWQNFGPDTTEKTSTTETVETDTAEVFEPEEEAVKPELTGTKYLVISDWGVKFPYIGNVEIKIGEKSAKTIGLTTDQLIKYGDDCSTTGGGLIVRGFAGDNAYVAGEETYADLYAKGMVGKIGDYYYMYQASQALCDKQEKSGTSQNNAKLIISSSATLVEAI